MKKNFVIVGALSMLVGIATAQQVSTQSNASVSSNTSVSAGQSGANVDSNTNANVSGQTSATAPKHQEHSTPKQSNHNQPKKDEKGGSMDATSALSAGTTVSAVLAKPIDSHKCKPGDEVIAAASEDVKADGKVVVKKGSKLIGHVTEASAKGEGEANSSLGLMFDRAVLKNGQQVQMNSVVQAIAAARTPPMSMESDTEAMTSGSIAPAGGSGRAGLLGGVGSTAGAATGAVANVGGSATGALNSTVGSTAHVGNGLSGALNSSSSGVVGMKGLSLVTGAANSTQGSVITSSGKSVHLDSGTQMMLRVVK